MCRPDSTCSASHALTVNSTNTPKSTTPSIPEDTPLDTEPLTQEKLEQLNQETSDPAAKAEKRVRGYLHNERLLGLSLLCNEMN